MVLRLALVHPKFTQSKQLSKLLSRRVGEAHARFRPINKIRKLLDCWITDRNNTPTRTGEPKFSGVEYSKHSRDISCLAAAAGPKPKTVDVVVFVAVDKPVQIARRCWSTRQ